MPTRYGCYSVSNQWDNEFDPSVLVLAPWFSVYDKGKMNVASKTIRKKGSNSHCVKQRMSIFW